MNFLVKNIRRILSIIGALHVSANIYLKIFKKQQQRLI